MRTSVFVVLAVMVLVFSVLPSVATEFRNGNSVNIESGTTVKDQLFAAGSSVRIDGTVTDDALGAGNDVKLMGTVSKTAMLAGGNVNISGRVGNNLLAAGGQIVFTGSTAGNASIAGGTIDISNDATVGRDLNIGGGQVTVAGKIGRNLKASAGNLTISGRVGGNVNAMTQQLTVGPSAVIVGNLEYTSQNRATIDPGAKITGKTIYHKAPPCGHCQMKRERHGMKFAFWLYSLIASFLTGLVLVGAYPRTANVIADDFTGRPGLSALVGLGALAVTPVAITILFVTLVGIPLALLLMVSYAVAIYFAHVYAGMAVGKWIFNRFGKGNASMYGMLFVGLVVVYLLTLIPFIGKILGFAFMLLGLGALVLADIKLVKELRAEGRL